MWREGDETCGLTSKLSAAEAVEGVHAPAAALVMRLQQAHAMLGAQPRARRPLHMCIWRGVEDERLGQWCEHERPDL